MSKTPPIFELINNISYTKKISSLEDIDSAYNGFVVNKAFSLHPDTIMYANDMNINHNLSNKAQHDYLMNSIRKRKRWAKWPKKINNTDVEIISTFYNISYNKAAAAAKILTQKQLALIKQQMTRGGKDG